MTDTLKIADGHVVSMDYRLTDDNGVLIDSSEGSGPMAYLHGHHNIVPGLEQQLTGHSKGDNVKASVPPEEAYGLRQGPEPQPVPREGFPPDAELLPGMAFHIEGEDGQPVPLWITKVEDDQVYVDVNHPLAGVTLNFDVQVVDVRPATPEEISDGHPHGPGGHDHH